jgi:carbonic anhydrase/acetyltransferase-like protein (isoleucine patch superfamily)
MALYALSNQSPSLHPSVWIAPGAHVIGDVQLDEACSIWFGAVVRGDNAAIRIGPRSQVQDGAVLHTDPGFALTLGAGVSIGHQAVVHGCRVGDHSLIGIQAVVLNGAQIGAECLIGAGTLIPEGRVIAPRSLVLGTPGRVVRPLTDDELARLRSTAETYVQRAAAFRSTLTRIDS